MRDILARQAAVSRHAFGPGARTGGVCKHITKELKEVQACYSPDFEVFNGIQQTARGPVELTRKPADKEQHIEAAKEWVDVAILGFDGLMRALAQAFPNKTFDELAAEALSMYLTKVRQNELRSWPDWRQAGEDEAIEHVRDDDEIERKEEEQRREKKKGKNRD